jgi:hypothetical protein
MVLVTTESVFPGARGQRNIICDYRSRSFCCDDGNLISTCKCIQLKKKIKKTRILSSFRRQNGINIHSYNARSILIIRSGCCAKPKTKTVQSPRCSRIYCYNINNAERHEIVLTNISTLRKIFYIFFPPIWNFVIFLVYLYIVLNASILYYKAAMRR